MIIANRGMILRKLFRRN